MYKILQYNKSRVYTRSPTPTGSGVGGWILFFFKCMNIRGGCPPHFLPKMYGN